jgi:hypothetical protein
MSAVQEEYGSWRRLIPAKHQFKYMEHGFKTALLVYFFTLSQINHLYVEI